MDVSAAPLPAPSPSSKNSPKRPFYATLWVQVLFAMGLAVAFGYIETRLTALPAINGANRPIVARSRRDATRRSWMESVSPWLRTSARKRQSSFHWEKSTAPACSPIPAVCAAFFLTSA